MKLSAKNYSIGGKDEIKRTITELCAFDLLPPISCLEYYERGITDRDLLSSFHFSPQDYSKIEALAELFNSKLNEEKKTLQIIKDNNMKQALVIGILLIAAVSVGIWLRKRLSGENVTSTSFPENPREKHNKDGFSEIALAVTDSDLVEKIKADNELNQHWRNGKFHLTKKALDALQFCGYYSPQNEGMLEKLIAGNNVSIIKPEVGALFDATTMITSDPFTGRVQVSSIISLGLKTCNGTTIVPACVKTIPVTE